jgi:methionyl-tRNA formyltransferase
MAICRLVRAVTRPYPGAFTRFDSEVLTIWRADPGNTLPTVYGRPGQITVIPGIQEPIVVTGDGVLVIREATLANGDNAIEWLGSRNQQRFELR